LISEENVSLGIAGRSFREFKTAGQLLHGFPRSDDFAFRGEKRRRNTKRKQTE